MAHVIPANGPIYGAPKELPAIPDYEMVVSPRSWLMARKDGLLFYVTEHPDKWELWEKGFNPDYVSPSNPDVHFAHTDRPVFVAK